MGTASPNGKDASNRRGVATNRAGAAKWHQSERERERATLDQMQDLKNASSRSGTETLGQDTATLDGQEAK